MQLIASGYFVMETFSNYVVDLCPGLKDSRTDQKQNVCINIVVVTLTSDTREVTPCRLRKICIATDVSILNG